MPIHTDCFKGEAQEAVNMVGHQGGIHLFNAIQVRMENEIKKRGIPATIKKDVVKSGGMFGQKLPILIITHPTCKYFSIGIYVCETIVNSVFLGTSKEYIKHIKKEEYKKNGNLFLLSITNPDEFKVQQEMLWHTQVLDCLGVKPK